MARVPAGHNRVPAGQTGLESQFILKRLGVLYYIAGHMIESQFILKRAGVHYYTARHMTLYQCSQRGSASEEQLSVRNRRANILSVERRVR